MTTAKDYTNLPVPQLTGKNQKAFRDQVLETTYQTFRRNILDPEDGVNSQSVKQKLEQITREIRDSKQMKLLFSDDQPFMADKRKQRLIEHDYLRDIQLWLINNFSHQISSFIKKEVKENKNITQGELIQKTNEFIKKHIPSIMYSLDKTAQKNLFTGKNLKKKGRDEAMFTDLAKAKATQKLKTGVQSTLNINASLLKIMKFVFDKNLNRQQKTYLANNLKSFLDIIQTGSNNDIQSTYNSLHNYKLQFNEDNLDLNNIVEYYGFHIMENLYNDYDNFNQHAAHESINRVINVLSSPDLKQTQLVKEMQDEIIELQTLLDDPEKFFDGIEPYFLEQHNKVKEIYEQVLVNSETIAANTIENLKSSLKTYEDKQATMVDKINRALFTSIDKSKNWLTNVAAQVVNIDWGKYSSMTAIEEKPMEITLEKPDQEATSSNKKPLLTIGDLYAKTIANVNVYEKISSPKQVKKDNGPRPTAAEVKIDRDEHVEELSVVEDILADREDIWNIKLNKSQCTDQHLVFQSSEDGQEITLPSAYDNWEAFSKDIRSEIFTEYGSYA